MQFGKKLGYDPDYDLKLDKPLARNEYRAKKLAAARAAKDTSLCAQVCTRDVWDKYKDVISSGPAKWTLARAINTGIIYPESFVGCHARGTTGEHSKVLDRIDVSNWRRIGLPEYELVDDMIRCANFLANEEDIRR